MANEFVQTMADARVDARSLSEFVFKPADFMVQRRLAPPINTLEYYLNLFNKTATDGAAMINQAIINSGFIIVDSFEIGATITQRNQALRHAATGKLYRWGGSLPKVVAASSTPTSSGGTSASAWIDVSDAAIRGELGAASGANLIGFNATQTYDEATIGSEIKAIKAKQSKFDDTYRTPINTSTRFKLTKGGYSWWCEPQSIQTGGLYPKVIVGAVDTISGLHKTVFVDGTSEQMITKAAHLKGRSDYVPDEHNAPVTVQAADTLITFAMGHSDVNYLPYRVSLNGDPANFGAEKKITGNFGNLSYTQAFYSSSQETVYIFFRGNSTTYGSGRTWYLAKSADWFADTPTWTINPLFTDADQLYVRVVPHMNDGTIRFLVTRNARYENNSLYLAYLNLNNNTISTVNSVAVGNLSSGAIEASALTAIYSPTSKFRLYDAKSHTSKIPILVQEFDTDETGGFYKYLEYDVTTWSMVTNVNIVQSGASLGTNFYFGGAHFSNVTGLDGSPNTSVSPIYVAREQNGTWYVEEWGSVNEGKSWGKYREIDSSKELKLWRPRVPFNTRLNNHPNQITLTWCKGTWNSYTDYDSDIWALKR